MLAKCSARSVESRLLNPCQLQRKQQRLGSASEMINGPNGRIIRPITFKVVAQLWPGRRTSGPRATASSAAGD